MVSIEHILLIASILLSLSILASKASARLGIPALLLFLFIGMLAGSDGPGGIYFDNARIAQSLGVVSLVFILFSGGLDTEWTSVRPVIVSGLVLSTLGVLITASAVGLFANKILGVTLVEGLLLGAIVSSTDAAAVFSVLKSQSIGFKGKIKPLLEIESGSNDPMAVFLTVGLIQYLGNPDISLFSFVVLFIQQMGLGAIFGYLFGKATVEIINRLRLEFEGLYPVLTLALILLIYSASHALGGSGFLAVYLTGLVMGNSNFIHKNSLIRFHDGLTWLMQIAMFLTLGLLVFPSHLKPVIGVGLVLSLFLTFVARPLGVLLSLAFAKMKFSEKLMVAWGGLRGAVPIILATFPLLAGSPQSELIFNLVFFIVLTSILLQGTSMPLIAKWLKVDTPIVEQKNTPLNLKPTAGISSQLESIEIPDNSPVTGKKILEAKFPQKALIVLISRNREYLIPRGDTILKAGDTLLILSSKEDLDSTRAMVQA
jgi:cell volume regulation protein A